jgi:hypothetical protein
MEKAFLATGGTVDTKNNFYFWVTAASPDVTEFGQVLQGETFDDENFRDSDERLLLSRLRVISSTHSSDLVGKLGFVHFSRIGWALCLRGGSIDSMPCLLTTDEGLGICYCGRVTVDVSEKGMDLEEKVGDGMPVVGDDWLGILTTVASGLSLISFSQSEWDNGSPHRAYCPWWSDRMDSKEGLQLLISGR